MTASEQPILTLHSTEALGGGGVDAKLVGSVRICVSGCHPPRAIIFPSLFCHYHQRFSELLCLAKTHSIKNPPQNKTPTPLLDVRGDLGNSELYLASGLGGTEN